MDYKRYKTSILFGLITALSAGTAMYKWHGNLSSTIKSTDASYLVGVSSLQQSKDNLQLAVKNREIELIGKPLYAWLLSIKPQQFGVPKEKGIKRGQGETDYIEETYETLRFSGLEIILFSRYNREQRTYIISPHVQALTILRDDISLPNGVKLGDSKESVIAKTGKPFKEENSQLIYGYPVSADSGLELKLSFVANRLAEIRLREDIFF